MKTLNRENSLNIILKVIFSYLGVFGNLATWGYFHNFHIRVPLNSQITFWILKREFKVLKHIEHHFRSGFIPLRGILEIYLLFFISRNKVERKIHFIKKYKKILFLIVFHFGLIKIPKIYFFLYILAKFKNPKKNHISYFYF